MSSFVPSDAMSGASQSAVEHKECPICFESLPEGPTPPGALVAANNKRVCAHYFHCGCVENLNPKTCPMCRAPFHHHVPTPNPILDSQAWFKFVDADGSGTLDYVEMTEALLTCLPCDWRKIETEMDSLFTRWSKGGKISLQDFSKPDGALSYIRTNFRPTGPRPEAPDIRTNRAEWFRYWDVVDGNGNGKLEKGEICRALIKTLHLKSQQQRASIADTLDNIWCLFDHDGSGEVDQAEFIAPEGLAETLSAELSRMELSNAPSSSASTATAPPFPPAASRVPAHVSRAWACGACTFENAESRATCEICGAGR